MTPDTPRTFEEINADIAEVKRQLMMNSWELGHLPPIGHKSPLGRDIHHDRSKLLKRLEQLNQEVLAMANTPAKGA
jgi:hypothetical protein